MIFDPLLYYPLSRIASLSKIFPTLMLYRLWEDGKIGSLDDPLEKYVENFTIKNPLGKSRDSQLKYVTDGLIFLDSGEVQIRSSSVTLRRMASQLSGTFKATSTLGLWSLRLEREMKMKIHSRFVIWYSCPSDMLNPSGNAGYEYTVFFIRLLRPGFENRARSFKTLQTICTTAHTICRTPQNLWKNKTLLSNN